MFSQSCDLSFIWKWPRVNSQDSQRFDFMMGGKGFCVELGERYQPPAMIAHDRHGDGSVQFGGAITMTRTELNICQGLPLSSTAETMLLSLLFCPMPWGCTYPSCMRCTRSLAVSQNQVSHVFTEVPRPCLQLDSCETPSGDVSGDGLTSHMTSTSLLMHSRRNGA